MTTHRSSVPQLQSQVISRRRVLLSIGANAVALPMVSWLTSSRAQAADDYEPLNRFPRMVHDPFSAATT